MKRYLLDLSISQVHSITLLIIVCFISGWWYFLYNPLLAYNNETSIEIDILKSQLTRCTLLQKECDTLEEKCTALKTTCNALIKNSYAHDPQTVIQAILSCANEHHLTLVSCETFVPKNAENILGATYAFKSSYEHIINFFACLESSGYLKQITTYQLAKISDSEINCILKYEFSKIDLIV